MYKIKNVNLIDNNIRNTEIKDSPIHGKGLFSTSEIEESTVLCVLDGQYLDNEIINELEIDLFNYEYNYIPRSKKWVIRGFLTKYSAINHSRTPNASILFEPLRVVVSKNIKRGEEIVIDYRKNQFPSDFISTKNVDITYL